SAMARAIDTIFFCPPLRLSPGRSKNLATSGNTVSACASASPPPAGPRTRFALGMDAAGGAARGLVGEPAADHEVFGHRQLREDAGILGRIADAALGALVRRELGDVLSAEANLTRAHREEARDALDDGGAPGAVAPDQRHDLPVADAQRHAAQDVRGPAKGIDGLDLEQHSLVPLRSQADSGAPRRMLATSL